MNIQRLRTLTTRKLHADIGFVYDDIEYLSGAPGIMTHHIPAAMAALQPYLRAQITDPRFWDGEYDDTHTGEIDLRPMNEEELEAFWKEFEVQINKFWDAVEESKT
jgi:hypothetical protein